MLEVVTEHGKASSLKPAQKLLLNWYTPLCESIAQEQKDIIERKAGVDRSVYGPNLLLLSPETLAVITMHELVNLALVEVDGVKVVRVATAIGRAVEAEVKLLILRRKNKPKWQDLVELQEPINAVNRKTRQALEMSGQGNTWESKIVVRDHESVRARIVGSRFVYLLVKRGTRMCVFAFR
jgi:DNA-directed RNA polymerase